MYLAIIFATSNQFTEYSSFSNNMGLAIIATLLALLVGSYTHSHWSIESTGEFLTMLFL